MSIYRGWRPYPADVHSQHVARKPAAQCEEQDAAPVHLRRAQPVLVLLPRTASWLAEIPPRFRPVHLAKQFARIANNVCATWFDPPARGRYLEELLAGGRPNRRGFPPSVLRELQTLYRVHLELCRCNESATWIDLNRSVWDGSDRATRDG